MITKTEAIKRAKQEILADVADGTVPASCASFGELHDYVDANGYGGAFDDGNFVLCADDDSNLVDCQANCDFWNDVQDEVNRWIHNGGLTK